MIYKWLQGYCGNWTTFWIGDSEKAGAYENMKGLSMEMMKLEHVCDSMETAKFSYGEEEVTEEIGLVLTHIGNGAAPWVGEMLHIQMRC